jgi:hypothetical protein
VTRRASRAALPLGALQSWFFERVTSRSPTSARSRLGARALGLVHAGGASAEQRIAVYIRGYFARLVECLRDDYPAVAFALGPASFDALCTDFIESHPPASPSLNFYGAPFPAFCAQSLGPRSSFVSGLARLEWAVVESIHADIGTPLDATLLANLPTAAWQRARLIPSPALRIVRATHPVQRYYRAFLAGEIATVPDFEGSTVAVCRRGADIRHLDVEDRHVRLLSRLIDGQSLSSALDVLDERATRYDDEPVAALQRAFSAWIESGFFSGINLDRAT